MDKKWLNVGLATTMLASLALVGCGGSAETSSSTGSSASQEKQELNLAMVDEIPTLDVSKATNAISFTLFGQAMEGLVRLDNSGKATPGVATDWKVSSDGLTYTFNLRKDAKWSNGDPVTAHDFEYSWKRTLDPATGAEYAFMVAWIKGGEEYNSKKGSADQVAVKAKDDYTLEVTLAQPIPFFVEQMAFPVFFPQNEKFVKAAGEKYGADADKFLSNGPFKLTEWVHEQSATIVKNDTYWDAKNVKLNKVTWQVVKDTNAGLNLYESGQIDRSLGLVREQVDQYKDSKEYTVAPELTNVFAEYNQRVKALQNAKVRQALTWALDGDSYADVIYHNGTVGATGVVPVGTSDGQGGDFRKDQGDLIDRKGNLPKAKETLAEGLKEAGVASFPKLKVLIDDGDVGKKAGELIQAQWKQNLGIDVEIELVPYKLRLKRQSDHDFDICISLWGADYNDPMTFLDMWTSDSAFNDPQWKNADYDKLIKQAKAEPDKKKRMSELQDAEKLLIKEMGIGPIAFRGRSYLLKSYVKGFEVRQNGPDYDLKNTYIQGKN